MSETYAEAIVETVRQPLVVLDEELRVESANRAFFQTFQIREASTLGRPLFDLGSGQWDDPGLRRLLERLSEETEFQDYEVRHHFPGIGNRIMLVNGRVMHFGEDARRILLAIEDVTERYTMQAERNRYATELERRNRDLEEFAHAASHDLQEPLRKIQTFAQRLESTTATAPGDRSRDYLGRIRDAARRLQERIEDLLALARLGRDPDRMETVDLGDLARAAISDLELKIQETGATVELGELPTATVDPTQIKQLLQNLLENAIKYRRPDADLRIRIRGDSAAAAGAASGEDVVRVTVEDNGIGFEPQYAERIFKAFERLHGRTAYEGSGVGLSICRRVVENHGGSIRADGEPGRGARFTFTLPRNHARLEAIDG